MPILNIKIRNNNYQIACDDGQENHLQEMAENVDRRLALLANSLGKGSDSLLLVMVALMMEDEIVELKKSLAGGQANSPSADKPREADLAVAQAVNAIADYVETLAKNIERY